MISRLLYYVFFGFCWILTLIPLRVLYILSDFLFLLSYHLVSYRKKITLTNLENSFPEKSSEEIQDICRKYYRHLCDQFIESFKLIHLSQKNILRRFNYLNPEMMDELYQSGKSVMVLAGHYATWEWIVSLGLITRHKVQEVYKPTSFKNFSRIYYYIGRRFNILPVPMQEIYKAIVQSKSRNELTATFILGDQSPTRENIKYWTTFLNQDTPALSGFERIARKTDLAVIFMDVKVKKRGYYDVTFHKISDNPGELEDHQLTEEYFRSLEKSILHRPEFWLWSHRRWKHKREIQ